MMMAYNPFYAQGYNYNPYYQQPQMGQMGQQQQPVQQMQQPTIQQTAFVSVQSEQEARAYPVAPGNSITFKDERQPYCYVKTMGFNQLDRPIFEKYRLVKEDEPAEPQTAKPSSVEYATKEDLRGIYDDLQALKKRMKELDEKPNTEVKDD